MPSIVKGATSQSILIFVPDSSSTTGAGLTGLVYNTSSLVCYYKRGATGSVTSVTLATQTNAGAYSSGGFVAVDGTNMPGVYRLDLPDAVCASGAEYAYVHLKGAANMVPVTVRVDLVDSIAVDSSGRVRSQDECYYRGTVSGSPSTTSFTSSTSTIQALADDALNNWTLRFTSGALLGYTTTVSDFATSTATFTVPDTGTACSSGDTFIVYKA